MNAFRFRTADGRTRAVSVDRHGERLPDGLQEWQLLGPMDIDDTQARRLGVPPAAIRTALDGQGYFILPVS